MVFLTGYHGTTMEYAEKIVKEKNYKVSDGDKEWLGKGIYFYFDILDAYNWRNSEAILHSIIKIADCEYLDIDSKEGTKIYYDIIEHIESFDIKIEKNAVQKNQCAVMKILWDTCPKIKVISASFPKEKTKVPTMIDKRTRRKEFCVRDNDYIKHTYLIEKRDLDD